MRVKSLSSDTVSNCVSPKVNEKARLSLCAVIDAPALLLFLPDQVPMRTGSATSRTERMMDSAVSLPVLGFSDGMFSM